MPLLGLLSRARARLCGEVRACGRLASGRALRELPQAPARDPGARDPQGRAAQVRGPQRHAPSSEEDAQEFVLMTIALQVFVTGLAAGGVYGLFAAGHTLIYRLTGMVNYAFPDPLPVHRVGHAGFIRIGGAQVQARAFFVIGLALALALGSAWLLEKSRFGRALRAVADDAEGARVVGVPVDLLVALAFGLVGALAMIAAIAAAPGQAVNANTGTLLGLKGLVAALAVRFGPPLLAFGAGLLLGVVESAIANVHLGSWQLGPSYREVLPLAFVLLLIAIWPSREALEEQE